MVTRPATSEHIAVLLQSVRRRRALSQLGAVACAGLAVGIASFPTFLGASSFAVAALAIAVGAMCMVLGFMFASRQHVLERELQTQDSRSALPSGGPKL